MRVNTGDFITLDYRNFEGDVTSGIFLVVYHEAYDMPRSNAFLAVKVSSRSSGYQIPISSTVFDFLKHDSYVNCSSVHKFTESEVKKIIGTANNYVLNNVRGQLGAILKSADKQLADRLR